MYLGPINSGTIISCRSDVVAIFSTKIAAVISVGVPSATGAQLVLPPLPGVPGSTTYQGTFDNVKFMDFGKPSGFGTITYANGNVYQGPIQEGPGGSFMPVLMAGELLVRSEPGVPREAQFDCTSPSATIYLDAHYDSLTTIPT